MGDKEIGKTAHIGSGHTGKSKAALLALMHQAFMPLDEIIERDKAYTFINQHSDLVEPYMGDMPTIGTRKSQLSKKQRKARSKAKNAKKARKNNHRRK